VERRFRETNIRHTDVERAVRGDITHGRESVRVVDGHPGGVRQSVDREGLRNSFCAQYYAQFCAHLQHHGQHTRG